MYRTKKKKVVRLTSISVVVALGAMATGVGVANAAVPAAHTTPPAAHGAPIGSSSPMNSPLEGPSVSRSTNDVATLGNDAAKGYLLGPVRLSRVSYQVRAGREGF